MLGRRALPAGRLARLGATPDVHHGLLADAALVTLPTWPYSLKWTSYPASACGLGVVSIVALGLIGRL